LRVDLKSNLLTFFQQPVIGGDKDIHLCGQCSGNMQGIEACYSLLLKVLGC